ncbi:MAG TPA: HAMP domain-containing sensor histidine kinase [Phycisphaerales bacterium]|nr:HAMP domain-containing sensor histidine kinase [Phycisphaerales bacterium]
MNHQPTGFRIFWICAIAVTGALVWISARVLRLENREVESQAMAERQQAIRLALWRMDSALTPVIAREASRPYFHYQSFYPTGRAFTRMLDAVNPEDELTPSPLLDSPVGVIRLYFQVDPSGNVSSPQAPGGEARKLADRQGAMSANIVAAEDQLRTLRGLLGDKVRRPSPPAPMLAEDPGALEERSPVVTSGYSNGFDAVLNNEFEQRRERLAQAATSQPNSENFAANRAQQGVTLPSAIPSSSTPAPGAAPGPTEAGPVASRHVHGGDETASSAAAPGALEENALRKSEKGDSAESVRVGESGEALAADAARADVHTGTSAGASISGTGDSSAKAVERDSAVSTSDIVPEWIGAPEASQLVFWRTVMVNGEKFEQGFWLDWQLTRSWLLSGIGDLLPWADLKPVLTPLRDRPPEALGRTLASIPAELVLTGDVAAPSVGWTPLRFGLLVAWLAVAASLVVTWRVLRALSELAERRGRFAAAVTHELRTPLTTFVLYSQMLAEDMVPHERKGEYLRTMKSESQRLAGIVESVLEYARLGRREPGRGIVEMGLGEMIAPMLESLRARAREAGLELGVELGSAGSAVVSADPTGVERVLTNLVDNACKYAHGGEPAVIELTARVHRRHIEVCVRDFGPGLTADELKRVFEPYFRGQRTTELGVPGVGLGLALARGVARAMRGDLRHEQVERGTMFVLSLPAGPEKS